jgi:hypothetical protein
MMAIYFGLPSLTHEDMNMADEIRGMPQEKYVEYYLKDQSAEP